MADVVLFHHALGLTPGVLGFADALREAGHTVHTPDLYDGRTLPNLSLGVAHAENLGFQHVIERGVEESAGLGEGLVYAGFSLGVLSAQTLAQTVPGAKGALLYHGTVPPEMLGSAWPAGLPAQMHFMEGDPWGEEDLEAARELAASVEQAELFTYPGSGHLFAEPGVGDYDAAAAALLLERTLEFLDRVGRR